MRIAVVGGGAAGLVAAGSIFGADTVIFDKSEKLGKKLYITGKGRCNFTNVCDVQTFLTNVVDNAPFLRSAISRFTPEDAVELIESNGCSTKLERGRRAFPVSDKASDIIKALKKYALSGGANVVLDCEVKDIVPAGTGFDVVTERGSEHFDRVIVCTGGKSYPVTGSDGSMFAVLQRLGHKIIEPMPALVGLVTKEDISSAEGLTLKNVSLCADGIKPLFGDMLVTDKGISGPIVLTLSMIFARRAFPYDVAVDLKPALTAEELDARILRDFSTRLNKQFKNSLDDLLPKSIIPIVVERCGIDPAKQINIITKAERQRLCSIIKHFTLTVVGSEGFSQAIITCGGVDVSCVDPKTMGSKIVKGLYICGEALDVAALTGGYNLHIAFATGRAAGIAASNL